MWLRILSPLFGVVVFLYSGATLSLGLGEISLNSQYNEPLDAEIRLLKVRDLSPQEVIVGLASREDFRRAGVDRPFFLNGLVFDVVLSNAAKPVIHVRSSRPVTEPYLNFLVEVQWPSGRLVREYTLLLDLPVFNDSAAPAATAVPSSAVVDRVSGDNRSGPRRPIVVGRSEYAEAAAPVVSAVPSPAFESEVSAVSAEARAQAVSSADSYRVKSGDTLWVIAEKTRPNSAVSVNQAMVALQQANPDAFINDNINLLRSGRVLRVPSMEEIQQINVNQAATIVQQQNRSWADKHSQQHSQYHSQKKAALTTSAPIDAPVAAGQTEGRLTLASADNSASASDAKGAGDSGAGDALQKQLTVNQEELDRTRRENGELRAKIDELESQIGTMEQLLEVTNAQMRALELAVTTDANKRDTAVATEVDRAAADSTEATSSIR
nr:LysM peptidoglycan-binding domain-containing protein [Cellvibrionaceae bacterium]